VNHRHAEEHAERVASRLGAPVSADPPAEMEPVEEFRARLRAWLPDNLPPEPEGAIERTHERWAHERVLPRRLWDGGFAGIRVPKAYGGWASPRSTERLQRGRGRPRPPVLVQRPDPRSWPPRRWTPAPTSRSCAPPAILKGEELRVQFRAQRRLRLAGCPTRADRDGDVFVLNGSKIWSSGACAADYAMCLARTNWDAQAPGADDVHRRDPPARRDRRAIRQTDGSSSSARSSSTTTIPVTDVVGEVDDGWSVANRCWSTSGSPSAGVAHTAGRAPSTRWATTGPSHRADPVPA
jgi:alkylation response protein AidB-like acyl-CoA dehydrogenase